MKKPTLFGLEITLTCPKCHKECPMYGYEPGRSDLPDNINQACVNHQAEAICKPPPTADELFLESLDGYVKLALEYADVSEKAGSLETARKIRSKIR